MLRRLFTLAILVVCLLWLAISYLPGVQAILPTIAFSGNGDLLATMGLVALVIFIAIQLWLVYSTVSTVRTFQTKDSHSPFRLKIGTEFLWTALPILMTVGLAWASYALWLSQSMP